jgi:predicted phage terminase large subunit-like protein
MSRKNHGFDFHPMAWKKRFFGWGPKRQRAFLESLPSASALMLKYCSDFWLRDKQIVDGDNWLYWIIKSGRGFGKTKAGCCWMKKCIEKHEPIAGRHDLYAMVGPTHKDVVQVMVPALLAEFPPTERKRIQWNKTEGVLIFPNGAIVYCYSSETEIRGPNISKCWCDELAKWWNPDEQFEIMEYAVRIGDPQILITTTPKKTIRTLRRLIAKALEDPEQYVLVEGDAFENTFLPDSYRARLESMRGTRKFRQEAMGEMLDDSEDAMFSEKCITENRVQGIRDEKTNLPKDVELIRIVVAVDPAGTSNPDSDETGIIVAGIDGKGHAYVLEDASGRYSPDGWATMAVQLYHNYQANYIVAEKNFGGDMVEHTLKTIDPHIAFKSIRASHGKMVRAEPIAAKYIQNFVHHVGSPKRFEKLEDQMAVFTGAPSTNKRKDDRLDAMVWALTELMINPVFVQRNFINLPNFG